MKTVKISLFAIFCALNLSAVAQQSQKQIENYFSTNASSLGLQPDDCKDWIIKNEHTSQEFDVTFAYAYQQYQGIPIHNAMATFAIKEGSVFLTGNRFEKNINSRVNTKSPSIAEEKAVENVVSHLGLTGFSLSDLKKRPNVKTTSVFVAPAISHGEILVSLCYAKQDDALVLSWNVCIEPIEGDHWWSIRVNAVTGDVIDAIDWVAHCAFDTNCEEYDHDHTIPAEENSALLLPAMPPSSDQYNVFAIPTESPIHGPRSLVVGPYNASASPFGWHDDNGSSGNEYTITRGNNVFAYEDTGNNDAPGYSPDGGALLNFDFPLNLNSPGPGFWDPAITNLFYMNNMMHDVWYKYGFDELSGNFQENNYGNGGASSDYVRAEAQDGSGTNNANFGTPPDGSNPRMQMYMWGAVGSPKVLQINSPVGLSGLYVGIAATVGSPLPNPALTGNLVIYEDGIGESYDACEAATNSAALNGNIAVIRRSSGCAYVDQIVRAEAAGAIAVIMVNNQGGVAVMGGVDPGIGIPAIMISQANGNALIAELELNGAVNGSIADFGPFDRDSDFDNGVIAHEYGHGISNRLTGGGSNTDCLYNEEQMGEGWSDWFCLMMTLEPTDSGTDARGIGTYSDGQATNGTGIRPAPYSTDWTVNNYTYGVTNNTLSISQPHGIGFIWCTMLWDLTWSLIDLHGYDADVYTGGGGNNIAMHLIMTGMKLQPCEPGFVDGRDAILAADQLLYNGSHECLIWDVFAKRGLGYSADQGNTNDRADQVQAFDLPPNIDHVTTASIFCSDYVWAENGQTYNASGTYYTPTASNSVCDSVATLHLTVNNSINAVVTYVNPVTLKAVLNNMNYQWLACDGQFTPIAGATSQVFSPTQNGLYAVVVSQGTCSDTSVCIFVNKVGLDESTLSSQLSVFPNPTNGEITIDFGDREYASVEVALQNSLGQVVSINGFESTKSCSIRIDGAPGVYFAKITADSQVQTIKILKE